MVGRDPRPLVHAVMHDYNARLHCAWHRLMRLPAKNRRHKWGGRGRRFVDNSLKDTPENKRGDYGDRWRGLMV
jgi:hypothetical protein